MMNANSLLEQTTRFQCPVCYSVSHDRFIIFGSMRVFACPEVKEGDFKLLPEVERASVSPATYGRMLEQPTSLWQTLLRAVPVTSKCASCEGGTPLVNGRHVEEFTRGGDQFRYTWPCKGAR